ncbi:MAG TPA: arsenate reductase ArsC [Terriglobia bacterium]|nr:arsenate reductase ArsC [Terriglobia bacterium]
MRAAKPRPSTNILFVCIGNSCRSQMAEAFANQLGEGSFHVWSAGSMPLGEIISPTFQVMREKGMALEGQWSKGLKDVPIDKMDVVVGMGCEVRCPLPAGFKGILVGWNIPDPYGHDLDYFRSVRDLIERQVKSLLRDLRDQRKSSIEELIEPEAPK